jgi:hypothetical protein
MRTHYWSCTQFADWLRGTPKPRAETGPGWRTWNSQAQAAHPVRYWLAETGLDKLQKVVHWIPDQVYDLKYYINNRWVTRTHQLTASAQHIRPGQWRDFGDRILPCLFDELVNFVELELAWKHIAWDTEARERYGAPRWSWGWWRWRSWRSAQAGLDYLDWESGLRYDETWGIEANDPLWGQSTPQAQNAETIKALYTWYTTDYLARPDPHDLSGWTAVCDQHRGGWADDNFTESERLDRDQALDRLRDIEAKWLEEDTEMLVLLIRTRGALWT